MADRESNRTNDESGKGQLHEEVQEELRREAQEGSKDVGQVGENRNVTGSSTWETLKEGDSGDRD